MLHDPWFYAVAIPAVIVLGLAKGGMAGMGNLAVPLLALVISPVTAAAITLPILIVQDAVSVVAFRRSFDRKILAVTLPGAVVGIGLGWLMAEQVSIAWLEVALGLISALFGVQRLWMERGGRVAAPSDSPAWVGALCGVASGFTSQLAHAGSPPFQIYVLPKQLARDVMVGTTAIFFATVNWLKVPAYAALGQFTHENLIVSAALLPLAVASTLAGVWLVRKLDGKQLYRIVYTLMIVLGAKLVFDGVSALF